MRDVLLAVAIIGGLGIMFVLALATTKYGEALEKERPRNGSESQSEPSVEPRSGRHDEPAPLKRDLGNAGHLLAISFGFFLVLAIASVGGVVATGIGIALYLTIVVAILIRQR